MASVLQQQNPIFDKENFGQVTFNRPFKSVDPALLNPIVFKAENLYRHAEISYYKGDGSDLHKISAQLRSIHGAYSPKLNLDAEHAKLNAALGKTFTLLVYRSLEEKNFTFVNEFQDLAIRHLTAALSTSFRHTDEVTMLHDLAVHRGAAAIDA